MKTKTTYYKQQLQGIASDLVAWNRLRSKGSLPLRVMPRTVQGDDIVFEPTILLPIRAEHEGSEVTLDDCRNVLEYYFWESAFDDYQFTEVTLSDLMFGEGTRPCDMEEWLNALQVLESYFSFTNDRLQNRFAFFDCYDGQIKLSTIGIDLIEAARHLYRTVGFKLMENNNCLNHTVKNND